VKNMSTSSNEMNDQLKLLFQKAEVMIDEIQKISGILKAVKEEVDLELCRKRILLHYDPFDLGVIQVWYECFQALAHMCSWAGLVPGHNESAGKRKSSKTKKGNKYLRSTEAAHSGRGSKNYLGALYRRIAV
jgi:hypothetical protein